MTETSTLLVREFPRTLRQQIHAQAALEGKFIHEVVIELLENALTQAKAKTERKP